MAANTTGPIWELAPVSPGVQIVPADTTTKKTLVTPGTNGTRVDEIMASSNDTAAVVLDFYMTVSGVDYYLGDVTVPIGAGYTTVARKDCMAVLAPVLGYLAFPSGSVLKVAAHATITAAKQVDIVAQGGDY